MDIFQWLINGLGIFLCLTLVVIVHEAGHFFAARWAKVEVEAFAIGWGKVLWSWKPKNTDFRLCLFPLGGYCKMKGDQDLIDAMNHPENSFTPSAGSLFSAPAWKRIVISLAGPFINLIFAFFLFLSIFMTGFSVVGQKPQIQLASEVDGRTGTPAERARLHTGDIIVSIDDQQIITFQDIQQAILKNSSAVQTWSYIRNGVPGKTLIQPITDEKSKHQIVGIYPYYPTLVDSVATRSVAFLAGFKVGDKIVAVDNIPVKSGSEFFFVMDQNPTKNHTIEILRGTLKLALLIIPDESSAKGGWGINFNVPSFTIPGLPLYLAIEKSMYRTYDLFTQMVAGLIQLFTGQSNPLQSLSGPIGIVKAGSEATSTAFSRSSELGWTTVIQFTAFLNLALFLMNLLPIPALDGGNIIICTIEGFRRKQLGIKTLLRYQQIGAIFVFGLIIFTTINDLGFLGK